MLEVTLLISVCAITALAVPIGISRFVPLRSQKWAFRSIRNSGSDTPFNASSELQRISIQARNTFATLRRGEGAASRLVEVYDIVQETPDTVSIYFKGCTNLESQLGTTHSGTDDLTAASLPDFKPGQHIVFHRPATSTQPATRRCYSLSGAPSDQTWRITVKDASATSRATAQTIGKRGRENSKEASVSGWINSQARIGDRFVVTGPQGRFTLDLASDTKPVLLIAAGVGITPIASMLHHELQFGRSRKKWLFYQVSDIDHAPLLSELVNRIETSSGIQAVITCSRDKRLPQKITRDKNKSLHIVGGRLDPHLIIETVQTTDLTILMCGPNEWMESMKSGFVAAGVEASNVHYESFGGHSSDRNKVCDSNQSAQAENNGTANTEDKIGFAVKFETSQIETTFDGSNSDLLSHAKANDVEISSGCRMGNCGSCTVKLLQGKVEYKHPPASSLGADEILPCVCVPTTDLVVQA
jgi:ferredoxin-NADP reductase/ferredoxin